MNDKDKYTLIWFALAALAGAAIATNGPTLLALFLCGLALVCAAHHQSRDLVMENAGKVLSGSTLRCVIIMVGAVLIVQVVGVELALLVAGDLLAYVEALAAVSLIAANTRLRRVHDAGMQWVAAFGRALGRRRAGMDRAVRSLRRPRTKAAKGDDDGAGAWAFA